MSLSNAVTTTVVIAADDPSPDYVTLGLDVSAFDSSISRVIEVKDARVPKDSGDKGRPRAQFKNRGEKKQYHEFMTITILNLSQ